LTVSSLLTAINGGESLAEIKKNLESSATKNLSRELKELFEEVARRSTAFIDVGKTRLIECSPEARKQALINKKLSRLCLPAGDRYLVAAPGKELKFIQAIESAGYILGKK
jgi:hypothetical protein